MSITEVMPADPLPGTGAASSAEVFDGAMYKAASGFDPISGSWTKGTPGGVSVNTRTAAGNVGAIIYEVSLPTRETALRGRKLTAMDVWYSVAVADAFVDVSALIIRFNGTADGDAPTGTILAGNDDADYDPDHNTNVKRRSFTGDPRDHKMTIEIPVGERGYTGPDEGVFVQFTVDDTGGGTSVVVFKGMILRFDETLLNPTP